MRKVKKVEMEESGSIKQGIGFKLLKELVNVSKKNKNVKLIVAIIGSIDSEGSIRLHKKLGFKKTGVLKKIGFKKNKWIDSIILQKNIWKKLTKKNIKNHFQPLQPG